MADDAADGYDDSDMEDAVSENPIFAESLADFDEDVDMDDLPTRPPSLLYDYDAPSIGKQDDNDIFESTFKSLQLRYSEDPEYANRAISKNPMLPPPYPS